jgi:hypothetical protein
MAFLKRKQDIQSAALPQEGMPRAAPPEDDSGKLLAMPTAARAIGREQIAKAIGILGEYKKGKAALESRLIEDEEWYKICHWEYIRTKGGAKTLVTDPLGNTAYGSTATNRPEPSSAFLFNAIANKHADVMDNYPEPNVLPRERSDEPDAKILSSILPVILERNNFERTYSQNAWEKLKHGTAAYGVFFNPELENGLGDIDIKSLDLMNLFWEPGITDIQKSRNFFIVDLVDIDLLQSEYPQYSKGDLFGNAIDVAKYRYDDNVDTTNKTVVVDWYYKIKAANGRTLLHYVKFVGNTLLFASENDPAYTETGWYVHGKYPVVFDTLFPEKGTPVGFGYIAITKDPQLYIDKLSQNILENSMMASKVRFLATESTAVNEEEFLDWSKPIVHVAGQSLEDSKIKQILVSPVDQVCVTIMQMKIDELKENSSNRDFSNGGTTSGVTAAAAIAALQEAGNKASRDMISASYVSYKDINYMGIELARQFYDEARCFRITGEMPGQFQFIEYSNANIKDQLLPPAFPGQAPMYRRPVFDITVKPQKKNPFSRMSQNELAKELYKLGFFNPDRAQEAIIALELMEFEGKEKVLERIHEGQTLLNMLQQQAAKMDQMAAIIQAVTGTDMGLDGQLQGAAPAQPASAPKSGGSSNSMAKRTEQGQKAAMTRFGQNLAARSVPNMNLQSNGVKMQ